MALNRLTCQPIHTVIVGLTDMPKLQQVIEQHSRYKASFVLAFVTSSPLPGAACPKSDQTPWTAVERRTRASPSASVLHKSCGGGSGAGASALITSGSSTSASARCSRSATTPALYYAAEMRVRD